MNPQFKHLLVTLDGSGLAEVSLPVDVALARMNAGEITLMHVIEPDAPATIHGDRHIQSREEAAAYLEQVANRLLAEEIAVNIVLVEAGEQDVASTIATQADEIGSDLVILATHGHGGIRDLLFGRVAQKVVQRVAERPLLLVPAGTERTSFTCETMALPLDGTVEGETALPIAQSLAEIFRCRVTLIRIVPTRSTLQGSEAAVGTLLPGATAAMLNYEESEARQYLRETAAEWFPDREVVIEIRRGQVETEIVQALVRNHVDLAVMSTHGRAGLTAFLEGSVGQYILSRAVCPIVLLRHP